MNLLHKLTIITGFLVALPFAQLQAISETELVRFYNMVPSLENTGECCFFQKYQITKSGAAWTIASRNKGTTSVIVDPANGFLSITDDFVAGAGGHVEQEIALFSATNKDLYLAYVVRSQGDGSRYRYSMFRVKNGALAPVYENPFPAVSIFDYLGQPIFVPAYRIMPWNAPINLRLPRLGTTISMCIDFDTVVFGAAHGEAKYLSFVQSIAAHLKSECILFDWDPRTAAFVESGRTPAKQTKP